MKKNRRRPKPEPITVSVPAIGIDTCSLRFADGSRWIFNCTLAREVVRIPARREVHWLSHDDLGRLIEDQVDGKSFARELIDGQDPRIPGIAAVIDSAGQRRMNLIDGLERAIKAFVTRNGFGVYVLDDAERDRCLWSKTGLKGIAEKIEKGELPL